MNETRPILAALLCLAGLGCSPPPEAEAPAVTPIASSSATRWIALGDDGDHAWLEAPAVVRASAASRADIAASVRTQVSQVHVRPGATVKQGDPVVDVAAPEWTDAAAAYQGAVAQLEVHRARSEELGGLRQRGLVGSTQEFEQQAMVAKLTAERDRAAATLRAAGLQLRQTGALVKRGVVTLRAPVAGVVTQVNVHPGQVREPGDAPFAHVQGEASASVEVRTMQTWPEGARGVFSSAETRELPLAQSPHSHVVDRRDGTHLTWFAFADDDVTLFDGLRGVVRMKAPPASWRVPAAAVAPGNDASVVWRRRGGATAEVAVEVLSSDGAAAWIRAREDGALTAGDEVAADAERTPATATEADVPRAPAHDTATEQDAP